MRGIVRYAVVGVVGGVLFAVIIGLVRDQDPRASIAGGVLFGVFMAFATARGERRNGAKGRLGGSERAEYEVAADLASVKDAVRTYLERIAPGSWERPTASTDPYRYEASIGISWQSWGERISVEVSELAAERTGIVIASRPSWRATLIDYGRNAANVAGLAAELSDRGLVVAEDG